MTEAPSRRLGFAFLGLSTVALSLMGLFIKFGNGILTGWQVAFGRSMVGLTAMLLAHWLWGARIDGPNRRMLLLRSTTGTTGFLCFIWAIHLLPLSTAVLLFFLFPAFAAIVSPWINKEPTSPREWACIGLALAGTSLVVGPQALTVGLGLGHLLGGFAAFMGGLNISLVRRLSAEHSPFCIFFYFTLAMSVATFLPATLAPGTDWVSPAVYWIVLAVGLSATIGQLFMNAGFAHLTTSEGGVVMTAQVPLGVLAGWYFFDEAMGLAFLLGTALIMAGTIGLALSGGSSPGAKVEKEIAL